jgi:hypothetical protein
MARGTSSMLPAQSPCCYGVSFVPEVEWNGVLQVQEEESG